MNAQDNWRRSLSKVRRQVSKKELSSLSIDSQELLMNDKEDMSEEEVEKYLSQLKQKTGLKNLWSGHKFEDFVDGDHTPDISTDSDDDQVNMKITMSAEHLRQLTLDSDEDELRIDYMRSLKSLDKNNNEIDESGDDDNDKPINLMNNIHFAELEVGDVVLSDNDFNEKPTDFLPRVYTLDPNGFDDEGTKNSSDSEYSEINVRKNIHMLDEVSEENENPKEIPNKLEVSSSMASSVRTEREEVKEKANDSASYNSKSHHSKQSHYTSSNFDSVKSSSKKTRSSATSSFSKTTKHSSSSDISKRKTNHDASSSAFSAHSSLSESTLKSTSILISDSKSSKSSRSKQKRDKQALKHSTEREKKKKRSLRTQSTYQKNAHTQTRHVDDLTDQVLNFRYAWKSACASNLANHVVDTVAMDTLTNYNPAVLAANDMLKFHLDLLKQHIINSQRLYDAYAKDGSNTNYRYTSYEDTLKFIKENTPKVVSYEEALREIIEKENS